MPKMIQIRNVPDPLHRRLKSRAALEGLSLSDFLRKQRGYFRMQVGDLRHGRMQTEDLHHTAVF